MLEAGPYLRAEGVAAEGSGACRQLHSVPAWPSRPGTRAQHHSCTLHWRRPLRLHLLPDWMPGTALLHGHSHITSSCNAYNSATNGPPAQALPHSVISVHCIGEGCCACITCLAGCQGLRLRVCKEERHHSYTAHTCSMCHCSGIMPPVGHLARLTCMQGC